MGARNNARSSACTALDELIEWLQQEEASYAERGLRAKKIVSMDRYSRDCMLTSRILMKVLAKANELQPPPTPVIVRHQRRGFFSALTKFVLG